ncbi:MAG: DoxX family membrane protein [Geminicoccaceae bacterium]
MFHALSNMHDSVFGGLQDGLEDWFLGLFARLVFAAVLFVYFFNSAMTKVGEGLLGFLTVTDNAYFQILPTVVEQYEFDASQIPFFPYQLIVMAGTYGEIILPILILIGLFTRIAALGMIAFVAVQSYVDIAFHGADEKTIGAWFDRLSDSVILDQRALWIFLLVYLVIRGAGAISLDYLFAGRRASGIHSSWT